MRSSTTPRTWIESYYETITTTERALDRLLGLIDHLNTHNYTKYIFSLGRHSHNICVDVHEENENSYLIKYPISITDIKEVEWK